MLKVEHITKNFGAFRALEDINIEVQEGKIFGLLGPNGAGKTTLIRIINHITRADQGTLMLDGNPMTEDDTRKIGYMPEERGLYKKMKVGEQSVYLAQLKGLSRKESELRLKKWFERFEIESWWNRKVEELSKGMQQKVQFIVTVVHEPRLLIFDEPFSGFDPVNATLLKEEILRLRDNGATVIFSTHNMSSVEEICDDIALINKSRLVLSGSVKEIRNSYAENLFHIEGRLNQQELMLPSRYSILNLQLEDNLNPRFSAEVKLPNGDDVNDLLQALIDQGRVSQFNEVLPSMNEIFIRSVQNETK